MHGLTMRCPDCWNIIGEHYLCMAHGGEGGFSPGAAKWKARPLDYPPAEAIGNLQHPWWNFLADQPARFKGRQTQLFEEMVP